MIYITKNLVIKIWIDLDEIDSSDLLNLYENTDDPSGAGTLVRVIKSSITEYNPSVGDKYLFTYTKIVNEPKTYSFYYKMIDEVGNESETISIFDYDVCLTPYKPSGLPFTSLIFGETPEELVPTTDYQTIYHYDINNPSDYIEDGKYDIDDTTFKIETPIDGDYIYYRTITSYKCDLESEESDPISINIYNGFPNSFPLSDCTNLFLNPIVGGKFNFRWNYIYDINDQITNFNIYYALYSENPSDENPSGFLITEMGPWILDGSFDYNPAVYQYNYTTISFDNNTLVTYKAVPVVTDSGIENEKDTEETVSATSDSLAPDVEYDIIKITLE